jgi:hypothetical protein
VNTEKYLHTVKLYTARQTDHSPLPLKTDLAEYQSEVKTADHYLICDCPIQMLVALYPKAEKLNHNFRVCPQELTLPDLKTAKLSTTLLNFTISLTIQLKQPSWKA